MGHPVLIALVRDHPSQPVGDAEPTIGLSEKYDTAIGTDLPAVKGSGDLLALDGWKRERQKIIVGHGGRGALRSRHRVGFSNRILRRIKCLCYFRHPIPAAAVNKSG